MSKLHALPKHLEGVSNALTCPQSVLFTNLSLRGNLKSVFKRIFGIDHAPEYIVYNGGAMRWDFSDNDPFTRCLDSELRADVVAQKFITSTARTSRRLVRTAQMVANPSRWRKSNLKEDLLDDLNSYWDAYEDHLSSLYKFWNVETLLTNSLVDALAAAGFQSEINAGLPTFIVPSEPNWFMIETQNIKNLKSRLSENAELEQAASKHAELFRFLSTVYNLGNPPSDTEVLTRIKQFDVSKFSKNELKSLDEFPANIARLGELERELTFWKTERLDATALADYYAAPMYKALSELLNVPLNFIFCMTRDELTSAITTGVAIEIETLKQRAETYCIALIDGVIQFYQVTDVNSQEEAKIAENGEILYGMSAIFTDECGKQNGLALISTNIGAIGFLVLKDIPQGTVSYTQTMKAKLNEYGAVIGDLYLKGTQKLIQKCVDKGAPFKFDDFRSDINKYIPFGYGNNCISVFLDIRQLTELFVIDKSKKGKQILELLHEFSNEVWKISNLHFGLVSCHFGGGMLISFESPNFDEQNRSCFRAICTMFEIRNITLC